MKPFSIASFLWHHIKPYKWLYLVMLIAPLVSSLYPFFYNYAVKLFIDRMVEGNILSYRDFLGPIVLFLSTHLILDCAWRISNVAEWKSEPYVRRSILLESYDYVQFHAYTFFQNHFTGALSSKIKGLLSGYDKFWAEMHHGLVLRVFKSTVGLFALCWVNWIIASVMIGWLIIYLPIVLKMSGTLNRLAREESESKHTLIGQISDKLTNVFSIFSFATQKNEKSHLDRYISSDFLPRQIQVYKYDFKIQIIGGILYLMMFAALLVAMIDLRQKGMVSIGDFAFVFGMALGVAEDVWHATISLQDFAREMGDLKSALSILVHPHTSKDVVNAKPLVVTEPSIVFEDVCFGYNKGSSLFHHLNLSIGAGEKIGLVGQSGAGKSSLINLLLRYFDLEKGRIQISGQPVDQVRQDSLRKNIAVIPQDTLLFHRTLIENIRYGNLEASNEEVIEASKKAHIHQFILSLPEGYDTYVGERGMKLSGGQRQRIAIARAILKDAPILILDEATAALDSHTEKLIQESLNTLMEEKGKTVIAIAHRLSTLKHMDRILVLEKGRIVEQGSHDLLISNSESVYKKLWDLQMI